jgi:predicted Zn-dependent protease
VVHELTHQVHGVLTADLDREIQDLYRRARARMDSGQEAFVSLYQASSVFEYLAEGVNSLFTPRRDRFDTRDILRERLEARDPALVEELHKLLAITDVTPFYPVAYTTMGDDELENGRIEKAVAAYRKAYDRSPDSEEGASKLSYALCVQGNPAEASRISTDAVARHPASADLQLGLAQAEYVRTGDREAYVKLLRTAMDRVDPRERYRVALDLGRARLDQEAVDEARSFSDSVLAYQSDNPEGLQLRGDVEAAAGRLESARVYFNRDIAVRAGTLGIRIAYAQALLMASGVDSARIEEAARQVDAARLADPEDPHVEMMDGWLALDRGHAAEAVTKLKHALSRADWLDLARVELARAELVSGDPGAARKILEPLQARFTGPEQLRYVYNSRQSGFEMVGEAGYTERHELARALEAAGGR